MAPGYKPRKGTGAPPPSVAPPSTSSAIGHQLHRGVNAPPSSAPPSTTSPSISSGLTPQRATLPTSSHLASTTSKRKRGVSRSLALEKRIKAEGKISNLRIPQDKWGPVGKDAGVFTSEVGVVCRMFAPLSVPHWSDMTDEDKDPMFIRLADEFQLDFHDPHVRAVTDYILGGRYSDYRHPLYSRFRSFKTIDEARLNPYSNIDPSDWNLLCDYVMSEKFQARSNASAQNRSHLKVLHCSGSKSFLRRREELENAEIARIECYRRTHSKDGSWTSPHAEEFYKQMMELKSHPVPEEGTPLTEDQICELVLGTTPGYVPGLGHGLRPNSSAKAG